MYYLTHSDNNKLYQNSSSLQLITNVCGSLHSHVSKYFYHPHHDINSCTMKLINIQIWFTYTEYKIMFWFSLQVLSAIFLILRRNERDTINVNWSYFCQILMKLQISRLIFEKRSNIKVHENSFSESRAFKCGQTERQMDRHDEASSRFSQFCESAWKLLYIILVLKALIIPTDAHNYKITGMLKTIKIPTIAPTCFDSRRNHHHGAISCLAKITFMIPMCS